MDLFTFCAGWTVTLSTVFLRPCWLFNMVQSFSWCSNTNNIPNFGIYHVFFCSDF